VQYVTLSVDVTQGCLANQFTPPQDIRYQKYVVGTEPRMKVCKEPSSYQLLTVPSVVGTRQEQAVSALQTAGFTVKVRYDSASTQRTGFVIGQDPSGGNRAEQTSTVSITVAGAGGATATVPDVLGMSQERATKTLADAGFEVTVVKDHECSPSSPSCDYRKGAVWSQSPGADDDAASGSTVTIVVNP
jgi:beta-lactam-binding protein with PASTA domain